jgi:protein-tyrosine phosphatase
MPRFRRALEAIAENPAPLVFHCTAGKDRTGLVAALLLGIARVAPVTIAADYALSSRYLTMMLPTFRQHLAIAGYDLDRDGWMLEAQPETMLQTLTYLDQRYGGAEGYAQRIGVAPQYIRELRRRLVE